MQSQTQVSASTTQSCACLILCPKRVDSCSTLSLRASLAAAMTHARYDTLPWVLVLMQDFFCRIFRFEIDARCATMFAVLLQQDHSKICHFVTACL